jgi:L-asparaginase
MNTKTSKILSLALALFLGTVGPLYALPNIKILATGGTIAGAGKSETGSQYESAKLPVEALITAVPQLGKMAKIEGEQISQVGSQAMTHDIWFKLAHRINKLLKSDRVDGVVITHGTDTMEETAYFLNLVVKSNKPVVLVGSMRASTALSADGAMNIYNAVAVAAHSDSKGKGVLVVMNDTIHPARDVSKQHTTNVSAFGSPNFGALGIITAGKPRYYRESTRRHTKNSEFNLDSIKKLPKVDIVYGHANHSRTLIDAAIKAGAKGLVIAGVGNGNLYPETMTALKEASKNGVYVVRSSRTGGGRVTLDAEVDDEELGFVVSDSLSAQKARILLMLGLTTAKTRSDLQAMFFSY